MNTVTDQRNPGESPDEHRRRARQGTSLSWVHRFRVTPLTLVVFFAVVGVLWYVLESTGLWLILFP